MDRTQGSLGLASLMGVIFYRMASTGCGRHNDAFPMFAAVVLGGMAAWASARLADRLKDWRVRRQLGRR